MSPEIWGRVSGMRGRSEPRRLSFLCEIGLLFLRRPGGSKSLRPDVQGPQGRGEIF